jgi:hypothetical protein
VEKATQLKRWILVFWRGWAASKRVLAGKEQELIARFRLKRLRFVLKALCDPVHFQRPLRLDE